MRAPDTPRVRVLVLARLFGGLKAGLASGEWRPSGVPAIYRLLEGLAVDPEIELRTIFADKEPDPRFLTCQKQRIEPIGDTLVLPWRRLGGGFHRPELAVTEIEQTARMLAAAARFKPDVVYATYATIHAAALLARGGHRGVVLRLMGVVPHHRRMLEGAFPVARWQLRAPFAAVVSSEDGSDPAAVMARMLRSDVPQTVRLNGCDAAPLAPQDIKAIRAELGLGERPLVCFLGRLEPQKGGLAFIDAVAAVLGRRPGCADVLVIGDGPLRAAMEGRVGTAGLSGNIRFLGALSHERAYRIVGASDVYVSVNLFGNLSNANLEALAAGASLVMPTSDPTIPLDTVTDRLIPTECACRYDRKALPDSLAAVLAELLSNPQDIERRRQASRAVASRMIRPWSAVVSDDIAQIKSIALNNRIKMPDRHVN